MKLISRKEAKEQGLKRYYTGKPCKRGHIAERLVSNGNCAECSKEKDEKNRERRKEYYKEYYEEYREEILEYYKEHYEENKDRILARNKEYKENNKEKERARTKRHRENNREKYNAKEAKRRARKLQATPSWADQEKINFFYECCPAGCHVDHIIPLNHPLVCGLHNEFNLQWLPAEMNISKSNKFDPVGSKPKK